MTIETEQIGDVTVVRLRGKYLDAGAHNLLREELNPVIDKNPRLVLDLANCHFMDSTGIGVLLSALRRARTAGGDLVLCNINDTLKSVFKLIRIGRLIEVRETVDDAIALYAAKA